MSLYTLWRLCPSCDFPKRFLLSCFPKFPASSTSFSTNLPYFSFGGTISREADMPNTTCMIYIMANITRSPGIRMQNLRKSKKTFCCFSTLFLRHIPKEQAITDDISSPHEEVEDSTDGTYVTMDIQLIPMRERPLLLIRRRHANPKQIRVGSIDGINDSLVVLIRELRLIRRRIKMTSRQAREKFTTSKGLSMISLALAKAIT